MPVVCLLLEDAEVQNWCAELRGGSFLLTYKQLPWEEYDCSHMPALAPPPKEVAAAVGNSQSYPVPRCSWDHLAALFPLSMISSLGCGVQVPLLCTSSQPDALVPKELIALPCCCGLFPHTNQNTKAYVERPAADRYILSLIRVLWKSTNESDFCLMREREEKKNWGIPFHYTSIIFSILVNKTR